MQVLVKNSSATWFSWVSNYMPILCNTTVRIHAFCETYISGQHRSACNMRPCVSKGANSLVFKSYFLQLAFVPADKSCRIVREITISYCAEREGTSYWQTDLCILPFKNGYISGPFCACPFTLSSNILSES